MPSFLLLLLLIQALLAEAQSYTNLTRGSTLTPLGPNSSIPSPSGDFAFGFYPLSSDASLFLLAIWFNSTSPRTVVWFANGDNPVGAASKLDLTADGQLSLTDPDGKEVWSSGAGNGNASHATLLDSGNLILTAGGDPLWQSFSSATDTLLPGQVLTQGSSLRSRLTEADFSTGRFVLTAQTDGNLVLYPVAIPADNYYESSWSTGTMGSGLDLFFNDTGALYFTLTNKTRLDFNTFTAVPTEDFYNRATLDPDGVFRQYVYPKSNSNNGSWAEAWTAIFYVPADVCQDIFDEFGSGACGFNSYCRPNTGRQTPLDCECPLQYSFIDPARKYKGCKPNFRAQSCEEDETSLFTLEEMTGTDWPKSDYEHYMNIDEDRCRQYCLSDCFCAVAIYRGAGECWKKKLPLSNGRPVSNGAKALIKVVKGNASLPPPPGSLSPGSAVPPGKKDRSNSINLLGSVLLGSSGFLNLTLIAAIFAVIFCSSGKRKPRPEPESTVPGLSLRVFTYEELEKATDGFREELGRGSFGTVYKGCLLGSESRTSIAVKRLDRLLKDAEKEFTNEVKSIGQTHHKNLVRLLGFCNQGAHRLLVYEYMSNGSLTSFLFKSERPSWNHRVRIAVGIARGLVYLHEECSTQIIHCDIKPHNVLLDDNFVARISDFGLAKLLRTDQTRNTGIRGTKGYVAPEWFKSTPITVKVDVYSFGVLLLEIVACRRNIEPVVGDEGAADVLIYSAYDCYRDGRVDLLLENDEEAMADMRTVERLVMVALWCIQEDPSLRPTMRRVSQMLEGTVAVTVPPDPSSFSSTTHYGTLVINP